MAQPYLHEHVTCVAAPATWLSGPSGQLRGGADGLYVDDRRVLSRLVVTVDGAEPVPVQVRRTGAASARFTAVLPGLGDDGPDPTVTLVRGRQVGPRGGTETLTLTNLSHVPLAVEVAVACETDFATMGAVKDGTGTGSTVELRGATAAADDGMRIAVTADPLPDTASALRWRVTVPPRESWSVRAAASPAPMSRPITRAPSASPLRVTADDRRLDALVRTGVEDLDALRRTDGDDVYYAAGSPWYLTLFGRDSLWAARLAAAARHRASPPARCARSPRARARRTTADTEEEPGKILHEVRPADAAPPAAAGLLRHGRRHRPVRQHRWPTRTAGACRPHAVEPLLPTVERRAGVAGRRTTAFVAYRSTAHGPGQPGLEGLGRRRPVRRRADRRRDRWRCVRSRGTPTRRPCAVRTCWTRFGRPGAARWRAWAADLARAVPGARSGAPAAIRRSRSTATAGRSTASPPTWATCSAPACSRGRERVGGGCTWPGCGHRSASEPSRRHSAGYNPGSYHVGSVWPHDTAIALLGLVRDGHRQEAVGAHRRAAGRRLSGSTSGCRSCFGGDDDADALPAVLPAAGLGRRGGPGDPHRAARPGRRRAGRAAHARPDRAVAGRRVPGAGPEDRRRRARCHRLRHRPPDHPQQPGRRRIFQA